MTYFSELHIPTLPRRWLPIVIYGALWVLIFSFLYFFMPAAVWGYDWLDFRNASLHLLQGRPVYGPDSKFVNPPYVALLLLPFALPPAPISLALASALMLTLLILVAQHYHLTRVQTFVFALSPFLFTDLLAGQMNTLVMSCVLLPQALWPLAAVGKPQVAIGLLARPTRKGLIVLGLALAISFVLIPTWVGDAMSLGRVLLSAPWNLVQHTWPLTLAIAAPLLIQGYRSKDERYFLAASPFVMPYVALGSFVSVWLLVCSKLSGRWAVAAWVAVWLLIVGLSARAA